MLEKQKKNLFKVDEEQTGMRLDAWLAEKFSKTYSRSQIQTMIRNGYVEVNNVLVKRSSYEIKKEDSIHITCFKEKKLNLHPENIPLVILFEDNDLIILNKPAGLVVHPGAGNQSGTLTNALLYHYGSNLSSKNIELRPGIVHRLDKDTSGVMVVVKNNHSHEKLAEAFSKQGKEKRIERTYLAVVWGVPRCQSGTINAPLGRATNRTQRKVVSLDCPDARHAVTHFKVLESFGTKTENKPKASLISCRLETGRTHQIRVHMAHIGYPIIGDNDYGKGFKTKAKKFPEPLQSLLLNFPRQALHAYSLVFEHPSKEELVKAQAPLPEDMKNLYNALRQYDALE